MEANGYNMTEGTVSLPTVVTNGTNCTDCMTDTPPQAGGNTTLKMATTIVLTLALIIIMTAVGCHIDLKSLLAHLRRPFGIVIGFLAQFVLLPLTAWGMGHALELPRLQALGMLVMSCCPGGPVSNLFTYWAGGDVSLSVSMTTVNTALSSGMLPFNLWLYGRSWSQQTAVIPYRTIFEGLVMTVIPVGVGMFIRWKLPRARRVIAKVGDVVGALSVVLTDALMIALYPHMFAVSWRVYVAVIVLPSLAYVLGYLFAWVVRMTPQQRLTVSLETSIQNFLLCMTLLALSFQGRELGQVAVYPMLFGVFNIIESCIFVAIFRLRKLIKTKTGKKREVSSNETAADTQAEEGEGGDHLSNTPMLKAASHEGKGDEEV